MNPENHYLEINRVAWNNKTEIHIASDFYDHANFLKGKSSLGQHLLTSFRCLCYRGGFFR
jgi:hypothetical protein